ncbi:MAG: hypothetical protein DRN11_03290 [Thermoplasmata archaeon]|nr:MAG: hypothetical protein DRN11_03290 [Thermoplasmata archaeon]
MKKIVGFVILLSFAFIYAIAQPIINSVSDTPDPVEVPGYNNITADITNATQAYVEIYYPNSTLLGNFSMNYIAPSTWYFNRTYSYPDPLGTYSYVVKAYNATGWATSATYTFVVQDTTSPTSSIDALSKYWYNSQASITVTASDNYAVANVSLFYRYSTDNATWGAWTFFGKDTNGGDGWSFSFTFPDGEGYYEFYSIANDTAGNTETKTTADESAGYDTTAPSSSIDPMAYWYTSLPVVVTASASDTLSGVKQVTLYYRYSSDNVTWTSWTAFATDTSSPWQWNFNAPHGDGYYEFYSIAEDNANNAETKTTADEYIAIDTTPPSTTLSASPSDGKYVTSSSVISLSASDNVAGVKTTYYRIWNGSWHPAPGTGVGIGNNFSIYSGTFSLKKEGKNYIEFYSEDNAGNVEAINNETLIVDNTPPSITSINVNPSSQVVGGYVNISCCVVDSGVGVDGVYLEVYYPDGSFANFTMIYSPCTTYYRNEIYNIVGTYDFTIYAKDLLGNSAKSSVYHFTITTGNNPPATPSKPSGPSSGYACVTYTYTTSTTDPEGDNIYYLFDWGDSTTSGWIGPFASGAVATASHKWNSPGTYYVKVKAKDDKGAESGWSSYLVVTIGPVNNPPITTASLSPSSPNGKNGWYISSVNVSLYATDPDGDTILYTKYRIDGGSWITYTGTFTISSDGEHLIEFYSEDDRGAVEDIKNITVKIDKSKPSVYIQRPVQGYLYLFNREIWPLASGNTIVVGWIAVRAIACDSHSGIDNVSFYVDGVQQSIDKMEPYEWLWRGDIGWRYLQVVAYNKAGLKQESDTIFLYIFSL